MEAFRKACSLSLSALDVESITIELPGSECEIQHIEALPPLRYNSTVRKIQKVAVFNYRDSLDERASFFFRVTENKPLKSVVEEFVEVLKERKEKAEAMKRSLLAPAFRVIEALKSEHLAFCAAEDMKEKEAIASFKSTLAGQFEKQLQRLTNTHVIMAFNGSSYDFVLLLGALSSVLYSHDPPLQLRVQRQGNKVRSLSVRGRPLTGVIFRDLCYMAPAGVGLGAMAKMVGLEAEKGLCPFSQLTSLESLDRAEFDWNLSSWRNDLTGKYPTEAEIEEVKKQFTDGTCKTVYDYLCLYLERDVELTLAIGDRLYDSFYQELGVHPVDAGKHTIASLMHYANQLFLFRTKRLAMYKISVAPLYGMTKSSCLGGLTQICRQVNRGGDANPSAALNRKLIDPASQRSTPEFGPPEGIDGSEDSLAEACRLTFDATAREAERAPKLLDPILERAGARRELLPYKTANFIASRPELSAYHFAQASLEAARTSPSYRFPAAPMAARRVDGEASATARSPAPPAPATPPSTPSTRRTVTVAPSANSSAANAAIRPVTGAAEGLLSAKQLIRDILSRCCEGVTPRQGNVLTALDCTGLYSAAGNRVREFSLYFFPRAPPSTPSRSPLSPPTALVRPLISLALTPAPSVASAAPNLLRDNFLFFRDSG